ncbi:hypothetical protein [Halioxenophilus sp. WMMB6]|uniref:hypothetical protein n=1 Tax=Halioxenophilus sp. WMMB6 TaxID=3073815 RepID=UPI00295E6C5F|nr:hypothetical protein [Halioxenophilus sp. WMMB6]
MNVKAKLGIPIATAIWLTMATSASQAEYSTGIGHSSEFSDNADLSETDKYDQREDRTWLDLGLEFNRSQWQLDSQYRFTNVHFDSDSPTPQPNNDEIIGATTFSAIGFKQRAQLDITHNRENLLGTPGDLELQRNLRARDTLTVSPRYFLQQSSRQQVYVSGLYNQVRNDEQLNVNNSIDSDTTGWSLGVNRRLTDVDTVGLQLKSLTTDYDTPFARKNDYTSLLTYYAVELRQVNYSLALGYNISKVSDQEDIKSPMAAITLGFDSGVTQIDFATQYLITDTSRGDRATGDASITQESAGLGNGNSNIVSRYDLLISNLDISQQLTTTFSTTLRLQYATQDHTPDDSQDQQTWSAVLSLRQRVNPRWSWDISARQSELAFDQDNGNDNTTNVYNWNLNYQASPKLAFGLNLGQTNRDSGPNGRTYDEQRVSLEVTYQLRP